MTIRTMLDFHTAPYFAIHTVLALDEEKKLCKQYIAFRLRLCFTLIWGCAEILPEPLEEKKKKKTAGRDNCARLVTIYLAITYLP